MVLRMYQADMISIRLSTDNGHHNIMAHLNTSSTTLSKMEYTYRHVGTFKFRLTTCLVRSVHTNSGVKLWTLKHTVRSSKI